MRTGEILHWLSVNFDHLRHYKQGKNKSIVLEAKKNAWFGDGEHRNILAQWTLIANEEGQLDEKLRSWRSKYKDEIEEEATNEEIVQFIFGI